LKGVLRSTDDGNSWTQVLSSQYIEVITSDSDGNIFAGTREQGIFRSTDDGTTWIQLDLDSTVTIVSSIASGPNGDLFVSGWNGDWPPGIRMLRSSNNGGNWNSLTVPSSCFIENFAFTPDGHIVASFYSEIIGDSSGFLTSSDNGTTWMRRNITKAIIKSLIFDSFSNSFMTVVSGSYWDILQSTDFGNTWMNISSFIYLIPEVICLNSSQNGYLYIGTSGGLKYSIDSGYNWIQIDSGFIARSANYLTLMPGGRIYTRTGNGIFKLADDKKSWIKDSALAGSFTISNIGNFFISDGEIHKSTDNGNTWTTVYTQLSNNGRTTELIKLSNGYILSAGIFAGWIHLGYSAILRSTDEGDIWNTVYTKGVKDRSDHFSLNTIAVTPNDIILAGGGFNGVIRSTDFGSSWALSMNGLPENIDCIVIRVKEDGLVFLGSGSGMFTSSDEGLSWDTINNGLSSLNIRSIAINSRGEIFIGTAGGVFESTDNGNTWSLLNNGLTDVSVRSLLCDSLDYLYAATDAGGVFRSKEPTTSVHEVENTRSRFLLDQNYPNPFNPTTTINYQIPQTGFVTLKVYDILGIEVANLVYEEKPAGSYEVEFSASGSLASGIYFYRLQAGGYSEAKKMILVK
jgi:photosystem II stability/assembly factor-like uncharacterized protein